jgi:hypothetical protein
MNLRYSFLPVSATILSLVSPTKNLHAQVAPLRTNSTSIAIHDGHIDKKLNNWTLVFVQSNTPFLAKRDGVLDTDGMHLFVGGVMRTEAVENEVATVSTMDHKGLFLTNARNWGASGLIREWGGLIDEISEPSIDQSTALMKTNHHNLMNSPNFSTNNAEPIGSFAQDTPPAIGIVYGNANPTPGFPGIAVCDDYKCTDDIEAVNPDKDGDMDLVKASQLGHDDFAWFENDGNQIFEVHRISASEIRRFSAIDLVDDGANDIISVSANNHDRVFWHMNEGRENATTQIIASCNSSATEITAVYHHYYKNVDFGYRFPKNTMTKKNQEQYMYFRMQLCKNI